MSDRAESRFLVSVRFAERAAEILGPWGYFELPAGEDYRSGVSFCCEQSQGGGVAEADELRKASVPFLWEWGVGEEFGRGGGVYDGSYGIEVPLEDGLPLVRVGNDGEVMASDLAAARMFVAMRQHFLGSLDAE